MCNSSEWLAVIVLHGGRAFAQRSDTRQGAAALADNWLNTDCTRYIDTAIVYQVSARAVWTVAAAALHAPAIDALGLPYDGAPIDRAPKALVESIKCALNGLQVAP